MCAKQANFGILDGIQYAVHGARCDQPRHHSDVKGVSFLGRTAVHYVACICALSCAIAVHSTSRRGALLLQLATTWQTHALPSQIWATPPEEIFLQ